MALVRTLPRCVPRAGVRPYGSASTGTGWPKPSSRDPVQPYERHAVDEKLKKAQLPENIQAEVKQLEGWLFGKKVIYLSKKRPYYEQIPDNSQFLFGERPMPPGYRRLMEDWEILSAALVLGTIILLSITFWAKPETDPRIWAVEELRERRILQRLADKSPS